MRPAGTANNVCVLKHRMNKSWHTRHDLVTGPGALSHKMGSRVLLNGCVFQNNEFINMDLANHQKNAGVGSGQSRSLIVGSLEDKIVVDFNNKDTFDILTNVHLISQVSGPLTNESGVGDEMSLGETLVNSKSTPDITNKYIMLNSTNDSRGYYSGNSNSANNNTLREHVIDDIYRHKNGSSNNFDHFEYSLHKSFSKLDNPNKCKIGQFVRKDRHPNSILGVAPGSPFNEPGLIDGVYLTKTNGTENTRHRANCLINTKPSVDNNNKRNRRRNIRIPLDLLLNARDQGGTNTRWT
jgi:hypothetical protein